MIYFLLDLLTASLIVSLVVALLACACFIFYVCRLEISEATEVAHQNLGRNHDEDLHNPNNYNYKK
jgi:hypothetical protein